MEVVMALAEELPDEAVEAFKRALLTEQQRRKGGTVAQLRVRDEGQLREAIAAAIGKVPLETLMGAKIEIARVVDGVLGVELDDPAPPEGWTPEGVLVIVRGVDPQGNHSIFWRDGGDFSLWEMLGAIECCGDAVRAQIAAARG